MIRFLRGNWTSRGGVVTPVYEIVSYYFIASKKSKNYHLLWFLVTINYQALGEKLRKKWNKDSYYYNEDTDAVIFINY